MDTKTAPIVRLYNKYCAAKGIISSRFFELDYAKKKYSTII